MSRFVPPWVLNEHIHGISFVYMPKDGLAYIIFDSLAARRDWEGLYPPLGDLPIMHCGHTMVSVRTADIFAVARFRWFVVNCMAEDANGKRVTFREAMYMSELAARIECELHTNPRNLPVVRQFDIVSMMRWWPFERGRYLKLDAE